MERRVPDSTSLHSSITEEDLEDARQRLLLHQEENGTEYTTPLPPHQPVRNQTQYGSVSTIQSSQTTRPPATSKSYRLPFLILLVFDFGLIVFLSIICSVTPVSQAIDGVNITASAAQYFNMSIDRNYFDLVLIGSGRFTLNVLFYLVLGWLTRLIIAFTTLLSAFYVPVKAYYCWQTVTDNSKDLERILLQIPVLLMLFVSFVLPWIIAFFFEFKYLPSELARVSITSWWDWRVWLWPKALPKVERTDTLSLPDVANTEAFTPHTLAPHRYRYTASSMSLDFRTPVGSSRASPVPDDNLTPIEEEEPLSPELPAPECDQVMSAEDLRFKREGLYVLERMDALTKNNEGWTLERSSGAVQCYSKQEGSRKIWKGECVLDVGIQQLWHVLYPGDETPRWNPQCSLNETVYRVDESTDVVYTVCNSIGPISSRFTNLMVQGRDFVSVRQIAIQRGCYFSASMSTNTTLKPEQPGKVRAENGPCGYKLEPVNSNRTKLLWIINSDLKGWLPQGVVDQSVSSAQLTSIQKLQVYLSQLGVDGLRQ